LAFSAELDGRNGNLAGRRQGRQDLSALDDRLLEDIGISREDALGKAGKPFWRA
jgi:uncharacterized protein YjiS (DUF1127 family)